jgi:hypothetical protein
MIRDCIVTTAAAFLLTSVIVLSINVIDAQVMQSNNYRIQSDSINFNGGLSSSTNYKLESTAGEIATGNSSSTNYSLRAGYQQMVTNFISMTSPSSVVMTPAIGGISGGTSNGSTTVTVTTDSPAGYGLSIAGGASPALQSASGTIPDYVPSGVPDFTFTITGAQARFGYSPSSIDVAARFKDNGAACNAGSSDTLLACWDGLSTTPATIAQSSGGNSPNGATTTVYFRVGIGSEVNQAAGVYTATTTLTAIAL